MLIFSVRRPHAEWALGSYCSSLLYVCQWWVDGEEARIYCPSHGLYLISDYVVIMPFVYAAVRF